VPATDPLGTVSAGRAGSDVTTGFSVARVPSLDPRGTAGVFTCTASGSVAIVLAKSGPDRLDSTAADASRVSGTLAAGFIHEPGLMTGAVNDGAAVIALALAASPAGLVDLLDAEALEDSLAAGVIHEPAVVVGGVNDGAVAIVPDRAVPRVPGLVVVALVPAEVLGVARRVGEEREVEVVLCTEIV